LNKEKLLLLGSIEAFTGKIELNIVAFPGDNTEIPPDGTKSHQPPAIWGF